MSIKNLKKSFKKKNLKGMDKYARMDVVYDAIPEIIDTCLDTKHRDEQLGSISNEDSLISILVSKKFLKTIKGITKDGERYGTDEGLAMVYNTILSIHYNELDEETTDMISDIVGKILKSRLKKIVKKTELPKEIVKEFVVILPGIDVLDKKQQNKISMYTDRMMMKSYLMAKNDEFTMSEKQLRKLFTVIAGKDSLMNIATGILLQRKQIVTNFTDNQLKMWKVGTEFALNVFEKADKYDIERSIKYYNKIFTKFPGARRLDLETLPEEDYPNVVKATKKIMTKENDNK